ncbi:MAG: IS200/IS605 family transposase [Lewinellaceae bacterium]|nr:IS200/IS605 family transposase [Saprospiraceae bacterium]MCB9312856.1 IS200/IS605 family transposase [Lewinellaceae bacterium]
MGQTYTQLIVHAVFHTKDNQNLIQPAFEKNIYEQFKLQFDDLSCPLLEIGGMPDHVHLLFRMDPKRSIADVMKQIKGGVSHWINQQDFLSNKFAWQSGYAAFTVSKSQVDHIRHYILTQKEHHRTMTFKEEYTGFLKLHGLGEGNG